MADYPIHPIALTYPPMTAAELDALTVDISARGLKRKIVLYEGQVLDGRCRLEACKRAGVEPEFEEYTGDDPVAYANSLNLTRDMTAGQRAIVAARQWDGEDKSGRPSKNGKTDDSRQFSSGYLSKHFRTSRDSIRLAKELLTEAPDIVAEVEAGRLNLAKAYEQLEGVRKEKVQKERQAAERAKMLAEVEAVAADFRDAIDAGDMTLEDALLKVKEVEREKAEREAAERDARGRWLTQLGDFVDWVEAAVGAYTPDELAIYVRPDAPGWIDTGVSDARLVALIPHLEKLSHVFSEAAGEGDRTGRSGGTGKPAGRKR